jgi:hypothetical protein
MPVAGGAPAVPEGRNVYRTGTDKGQLRSIRSEPVGSTSNRLRSHGARKALPAILVINIWPRCGQAFGGVGLRIAVHSSNQAGNYGHELIRFNRFGDMSTEACQNRLHAILDARISGQGNRRYSFFPTFL